MTGDERAAPRSGPAKILIVDDERDIVEYLTMALEDAGFKAAGLADTEGALAWIAAERPDLVLLDVMMPGHTGLSLYRAMREGETTKRIPVVIISGYARKERCGHDGPERAGVGTADSPRRVPGEADNGAHVARHPAEASGAR